MEPLYKIIKIGCMYHVISLSGLTQFKSMTRANCRDWISLIAMQTNEQK